LCRFLKNRIENKYNEKEIWTHFKFEWPNNNAKIKNYQVVDEILYRHLSELSSIQLTGTQSPTKRGYQAVATRAEIRQRQAICLY
jgi:hypothetical protein